VLLQGAQPQDVSHLQVPARVRDPQSLSLFHLQRGDTAHHLPALVQQQQQQRIPLPLVSQFDNRDLEIPASATQSLLGHAGASAFSVLPSFSSGDPAAFAALAGALPMLPYAFPAHALYQQLHTLVPQQQQLPLLGILTRTGEYGDQLTLMRQVMLLQQCQEAVAAANRARTNFHRQQPQHEHPSYGDDDDGANGGADDGDDNGI